MFARSATMFLELKKASSESRTGWGLDTEGPAGDATESEETLRMLDRFPGHGILAGCYRWSGLVLEQEKQRQIA